VGGPDGRAEVSWQIMPSTAVLMAAGRNGIWVND